jgi:polysaccharide export outer membrane protein
MVAMSLASAIEAQTKAGNAPATPGSPGAGAAPKAANAPADVIAAVPPGYVIGADDVLTIFFWREKDLSGDVVVRPDGRISIPLLNEVVAAGLTPEQLRVKVSTEAERYVQDPTVSVVVKQINSRKVFITGEIGRPGAYPLSEHMTVVQLIALAGGLHDFADKSNIIVMRAEKAPNGTQLSYKINYSELIKRQKLQQNIELKPGDTIIVP